MTRILLHEPAFRRIEARLDADARGAEFLRLEAGGTVRLADREIPRAEALPEAGWMSPEMFGAPAFRDWVALLLGAPELKWVQSAAAGFDNPVFKQMVAKGARLTTNTAQSVSIAEYVLWGVLDHLQRGRLHLATPSARQSRPRRGRAGCRPPARCPRRTGGDRRAAARSTRPSRARS